MSNSILNLKLFFIACLAVALGVQQVSAQEKEGSAYHFSLGQAIEFALKNQVSIQNAVHDEEIAKNKVKEIVGIGLPQLNGSFDLRDFIEIPTSLVPGEFFGAPPGTFIDVKFGTKYNATAGIDASQLLFSSDYLVGLQATKVFLELSRKATQRTRIEAAQAVSKAYYSVLINDERMKLMEANIMRIKKLKDDTKLMFENGFVEKIDVDRITVAYNNLEIEKQKIERFMKLSHAMLKFQMGMEQAAALTLTDKLSDITFSAPELMAEKFDYTRRVEYSLLENQRRASWLELRKNRLGYLPNAALYGSVSATAMRDEFNIFNSGMRWFPTAVVGVRVGIPIFDGLQKNYRIQQSKLALVKSDNDLKALQQGIDLELENTRIMLQNASSTLGSQRENLTLAEEVYRVAKLKYDQGVGSNLEVLDAETSLKEAQANYYNALYEALISKVEYEKATGVLMK